MLLKLSSPLKKEENNFHLRSMHALRKYWFNSRKLYVNDDEILKLLNKYFMKIFVQRKLYSRCSEVWVGLKNPKLKKIVHIETYSKYLYTKLKKL